MNAPHRPNDVVSREEFEKLAARCAHMMELIEDLSDELEISRLSPAELDAATATPDSVYWAIREGGNPIKVWREYRKLKGKDLAAAAGITASYLSELESGNRDGTAGTLAKIAEALGRTVNDLLPREHAA